MAEQDKMTQEEFEAVILEALQAPRPSAKELRELLDEAKRKTDEAREKGLPLTYPPRRDSK